MIVVGVVGRSGSGKTTLVERLVPALAETRRVGTVKSIHHEVELDESGTDTYRHRIAGAAHVVGVTPTLTASFRPVGKADGEDVALERALDEFGDDVDVVLVEGFTDAPLPKIVVGDAGARAGDAGDAGPGEVLARVADSSAADVDALVERILALDGGTH